MECSRALIVRAPSNVTYVISTRRVVTAFNTLGEDVPGNYHTKFSVRRLNTYLSKYRLQNEFTTNTSINAVPSITAVEVHYLCAMN